MGTAQRLADSGRLQEAAKWCDADLVERGPSCETYYLLGLVHTEEHAVGYYNTGDRMKCWGKRGAFWGGFWGVLFGSVFFAIPGIGPVLVAGPLVVWIVTSERALADLNKRFLEHGVGCAFVDNELIRKDNEHLHQQAVLPALSSIL